MDENKKFELNNQELNLNLISLDKFEKLPQKKQEGGKTQNLKKKKKKNQGKKLLDDDNSCVKESPSATAESASTTSKVVPTPLAPLPNNQRVNAPTTTINKKDEPAKLPFPFQLQQATPNIQQPFYSHPHSQMNVQRFRTPVFYPPVYPQVDMKRAQPPSLYLPKEQSEKVQSLPIIDPINRKQIKISHLFVKERIQIETETKERIQDNEGKKFTTPLHYNKPKPRRPEPQKVIYMIPDMIIEKSEYVPISFPTTELWFDHLNSTLTSPLRRHENNYCIAVDCEMVGVGEKGKNSVLARVSIVNYYGEVLLDRFVKSTKEITDYRTKFSGITPELLVDANEFKQVQREVKNIMKGHIVVGQSIYFDFRALKTGHPEHLIRDTALYNTIFGIETEKSGTPSLKKLAKDVLGINIQEGEHDSIEDARASMILYRHRQAEWEEHLKTNGFPKPRACKHCDSTSHVSKRCPNKIKKSKDDEKDNQNNVKSNNDKIDYDEYNRDPFTSKYYSYYNPNNCNIAYTPITYHHYNYHNINRYS